MSDDDRAAKAARAKALVRLSYSEGTQLTSLTQLNKKRQQKKPGPVSTPGTSAGTSVTPTLGSPLVRALSPPLADSSEDVKVDVTEMWVSKISSRVIFN